MRVWNNQHYSSQDSVHVLFHSVFVVSGLLASNTLFLFPITLCLQHVVVRIGFPGNGLQALRLSPWSGGYKSLFSRGCVYFPPLFMGVLYGCCLTLFLWILYLNCHFTRWESPLRDTNVLEKTLITVSFCTPFFDHRTAMRQVLLLLLLSIEKHCTGKRELRYNWLLSSHCNNFASGNFRISLILHNNGLSIAKIKHSQSTEGIIERHSSVLLTFIKNNK